MPYKDPAEANRKRRERYYASLEHERDRNRRYYAENRESVIDRVKKRSAEWYRSHPDETWAYQLKKAHSMYPEQWYAMWEEQGGLCYLGGHPLPEERRKVAIDHDHRHCPRGQSCGTCRRGLACANCNSGIGLFLDDPELLRRVADNLEQARELTTALLLTAPQQGELDLGLGDPPAQATA